MNAVEIVSTLLELNIPADSYVVFGSGPLARAGLRETGDIDLFVSESLLAELEERGWEPITHADGTISLQHGEIEAYSAWRFGDYLPHVDELRKRADVYEGIPFASLGDVREWKQARGSKIDLQDIMLIDEHLSAID